MPAFRNVPLGRFQAELKVLGYDQDTNIVVVSDHGCNNVADDAGLFLPRSITAEATGVADPNGCVRHGWQEDDADADLAPD